MFRPRRAIPKPVQTPRHTSENPMFPPADSQRLRTFRRIVLAWTAGTLGAVLGLVWLYGPWTRIEHVTVEPPVFVRAESVEKLADYYLRQRILSIFPRRQYAFFRPGWLAQKLKLSIEERIIINQVEVKRTGHSVMIRIDERVPVATWVTDVGTGWLDGEGRIVNLGALPPSISELSVQDQGNLPFRLNDQVVDPSVVKSIQTLNDAFRKENYPIDRIELPLLKCLEPPVEPEQLNMNVNGPSQDNTNQGVNQNTNQDLNVNVSPGLPCQAEELRTQRPEIVVRLKDGPMVRFDRYTNLTVAVRTLFRVLHTKEYQTAITIDLRFPERAYIR